jgi:hypothetical protein
MTAAVGSSVVGHFCCRSWFFHSGMLLLFYRVLDSDDVSALMPSGIPIPTSV